MIPTTEHSEKENMDQWLLKLGWHSWLEHLPMTQKVMGSIPSQGMLGLQVQSLSQGVCRSNRCFFHIYVSPLTPSPISMISKHVPG